MTGFLINLFAGSETFNGGVSSWILNFFLIALLVFVVSAYCLSIAQFLAYLEIHLVSGAVTDRDTMTRDDQS